MTLPTGTIYMSQIRDEFGGSNPAYMSQYYAGGARVYSGAPGIPSSGTIYYSQFRGKQSRININYTNNSYLYDFNLYNLMVGLVGYPSAPVDITFYNNSYISGTPWAFNVGTGWPSGSTIVIVNNGYILGTGGNGGAGGTRGGGYLGGGGTHALLVQTPGVVVYNHGGIYGGGGGGGGGHSMQTPNPYDWIGRADFSAGGGGGGGGAGGNVTSYGGAGGVTDYLPGYVVGSPWAIAGYGPYSIGVNGSVGGNGGLFDRGAFGEAGYLLNGSYESGPYNEGVGGRGGEGGSNGYDGYGGFLSATYGSPNARGAAGGPPGYFAYSPGYGITWNVRGALIGYEA